MIPLSALGLVHAGGLIAQGQLLVFRAALEDAACVQRVPVAVRKQVT